MLSKDGGTEISLPCSRGRVVPKYQYHALEADVYLNFGTMPSRDGGTEISVPCSLETVGPKFQCHALEGRWYMNFVT